MSEDSNKESDDTVIPENDETKRKNMKSDNESEEKNKDKQKDSSDKDQQKQNVEAENKSSEDSDSEESNENESAETKDGNDEGAPLTIPEEERPPVVPVVPIYGRPFMPTQVLPVQIAQKWEETIRRAVQTPEKMMLVVAMSEDALEKNLDKSDFNKVGCLVRIIQAKIDENDIQFVAQGITRGKVFSLQNKKKYLEARVEYPEATVPDASSTEGMEVRAYAMSLAASIKDLLPLNPLYFEELKRYLSRFNPSDPSLLADCAASLTSCSAEQLQEVLDTVDLLPRLKLSLKLLKNEIEVAKLQKSISDSVNEKINEKQKEYFLREQLKEIQKELGITIDDKTQDVNRFTEQMSKLKPPKHVKDRFDEEIKRLSVTEPSSPEYGVSRDYLTWLVSVPWGITAKENFNFEKAKKILETDHEGLRDVKDRIIEFLAVGAHRKSMNGAILLFVGPPGVGKTSIGRSIAHALNRYFFRFSLGGINDEAEIRGHRRTYIGALPGKLVMALREAKVMNPVIMLDEVDKVGSRRDGDPSSALLEVLDPEQNNSFRDNYLDLKVDLSKCLFICTANSTDTIPEALLDRMDVIRLPGYLAEEKLQIAKKHLIPNVFKKDGVDKKEIKFTDDALKKIIDEYAREAGVRSLEKDIDRITRKKLTEIIESDHSKKTVKETAEKVDADKKIENEQSNDIKTCKTLVVKSSEIRKLLGAAPFEHEKTLSGVGVITGLAWTSMGGATLPIEVALIDRSARGLHITGNLGQVMKESADIALSYVISHLKELAPDVRSDFFEKALIHLHVPEGAIPKDGPSAGVTMASAFLSLAMNKAPHAGFAMTGEISLTGSVLAIGGIREKVIAAKRVGILKLIVPKANKMDVEDLQDYIKDKIEFHYADTYKDVAAVLFG